MTCHYIPWIKLSPFCPSDLAHCGDKTWFGTENQDGAAAGNGSAAVAMSHTESNRTVATKRIEQCNRES